MFTRLTATVTMSAPDASCACAMTGNEGYLPVPTMSRDRNVRPAMTNALSVTRIQNEEWDSASRQSRAPTHEIHDLHAITVVDDDMSERVAFQYGEVVLHRDAARIDGQP